MSGIPPEVERALSGGIRSGKWIRARCPYCGKANWDRSLAAWADNWSQWECYRCHAEQIHGAPRRREIADARRKSELRDDAGRRRAMAMKIWDSCVPIRRGDPVDLYLRGRKLEPPGGAATWPSSLRLCPSLYHPQDKAHHPAMVAVVSDIAGMPCAIHRTYLSTAGRKALVRPVKMSLGPIRGAAIRLGHGPRIIVAEGIESALAAEAYHRDLKLAPWSALSAGGIETLQIPREVRQVILARDRGKAGRKAADTLRRRILALEREQRRIIHFAVYVPIGDDFADR